MGEENVWKNRKGYCIVAWTIYGKASNEIEIKNLERKQECWLREGSLELKKDAENVSEKNLKEVFESLLFADKIVLRLAALRS